MSEPTWMKRPSGPGIWLCLSLFPGEEYPHFTAVVLNADHIASGAPFYAPQVFGPIPEPVIENAAKT